ncbi:5-carboxymethyl-2-hydroxymuconate Delta-isomerase [Methylophaga sp.]|uniref:5-carboxymethyl-2-hydroxymuconate Delta-isomerase n=1 Tax=Methylophaga sp. TaxID=2024840 RepID=UPI00271BC1E2|nr:5-carboxymethyl-2-hydroxymuconate Delta-isomerase [Methylophaga sp.]MDO8828339.1 5-carboxymethyl-2-hydroxymuconate Delta-isomerase [Methylophaga sp.]
MPHCIIEYSNTLDINPARLVEAVHQAVVESDLFDASHIKTRAVAYEHFRLADNSRDFIHVTIRLHGGRTAQQKQHLTASILQALHKLRLTVITITAEAVDIDSDSYAKLVIT